MEDNRWSLPATIDGVVEILRSYLRNSSDLNKFKGTMKMLDLLEEKLKLLHENLLHIGIDREKEIDAWLRQVEEATDDAVKLVKDMEGKSVPEAGESTIPDIMTWFRSDSSSLLRMKYAIGRLVSLCTEGESILDMPNLDKDAQESVKNDNPSLVPDYSYVVGRDKEIAMILDMILGDACFQVATSIENRESADSLQISQKGWIIKTLQNINLSQQCQQDVEVAPYQKEMGGTVEYTRVDNSTVTEMRNPIIIPMVGISGVGKTALAQFIFNDKRIQKHFQDQSAWVYCTDNIRMEELMTKILVSLQPQQKILAHGNDLNRLNNQLRSCIEGKRFLLVLDDVSDEMHAVWGDVRNVLSSGAPGSAVLVTTQLYGVASFMGTTTPVFLDPLPYDDLWKIFKHHAFTTNQSTRVLESVGTKIADKLLGLPLAATMIGVSLRNYLDEVHWYSILKSWWWNVSSNSLRVQIAASLGVCYCELPAYLRQCLVYCSLFPRNYIFGKHDLVQMWIANGFIDLNNTSGPRSLEDVAAEWFDELVNRRFLQPTIWKLRYVMHDLVRDFAIALTSNEYCGVGCKLVDLPRVRHLSIDMDDMNVPWADYSINNLRSLMWFGGFHDTNSSEDYNTVDSLLERSYDTVDCLPKISYDTANHADMILRRSCLTIDNILRRSTSLRLLNLSNMRPNAASACIDDHLLDEDRIAVFVKFIARHRMLSRLTHLRYLDFSYSGITEIPDALCTLCNLQVLGLRGCAFTQLPKSMKSLISLRHLHADADTIALIHGIGELTKLQKLSEFHVKAKDGHRIAELRNLNDIRGSLCIVNLEMVNDPWDVRQANIDGKPYLTDLELKWSDNIKFEDTRTLNSAEKLVGSSSRNLRVLKLFGYPGVALPDRVGQLKYIRVIEISSCKILQNIPPLGHLEHLRELKFHSSPLITIICSKSYGTSHVLFQSLEVLSFEEMQNWASWTHEDCRELVPNLQKLQILNCHKLRKVPFESLGSAIKDLCLRSCGRYAPMISGYLPRLTHLIRLDIHCTIYERGDIILPCAELRSLEYLDIQYFRRVCIKGGLWYIVNLKDLRISRCQAVTIELHKSVETHEDMHHLAHLTLGSRPVCNAINYILSKTPILRTLCLYDLFDLKSTFEQWLQQLASLQVLEISRCRLPSSLPALPSLKKLILSDYCLLDEIPPNSLPHKLKELQIEQCSITLEARCQKRSGEVWTKEKITEWRRQEAEKWRSGKIRYGRMKMLAVLRSVEAQQWLPKKGEVSDSSIEQLLESAEEEILQVQDQASKWLHQRGKALRQQKGNERYDERSSRMIGVDYINIRGLLKSMEDKWLKQISTHEWQGKGKDKNEQLREMKEVYCSNVAELLKNSRDKWLLDVAHRLLHQKWTGNVGSWSNKWEEHVLRQAVTIREVTDEQWSNEKEKWLKNKEEQVIGKDWPNIAHVPYIRVRGDIVQNLYT